MMLLSFWYFVLVDLSNGLKMPEFSWDTVAIFIQMCNANGPFNESTAQHIARFPLVTIEKAQRF